MRNRKGYYSKTNMRKEWWWHKATTNITMKRTATVSVIVLHLYANPRNTFVTR